MKHINSLSSIKNQKELDAEAHLVKKDNTCTYRNRS